MLLQRWEVLMMVVCALTVVTFFSGSVCAFAQDKSTEESENAKRIAATITGLDALSDVQVTATEVTVTGAEDNTPIDLFKERIIGRPLWKVSYKIDGLKRRYLDGRHTGKVNPYIRGFDVYVDVATEQVLKVVSRYAPNMPETYQIDIETSRKEIISYFRQKRYMIENGLPIVVPTVKFADLLRGRVPSKRHLEVYYFLYHRTPQSKVAVPAWLVIYYGAAGFAPSGPNPKRYMKPEDFRRGFGVVVYDATSGKKRHDMEAVRMD